MFSSSSCRVITAKIKFNHFKFSKIIFFITCLIIRSSYLYFEMLKLITGNKPKVKMCLTWFGCLHKLLKIAYQLLISSTFPVIKQCSLCFVQETSKIYQSTYHSSRMIQKLNFMSAGTNLWVLLHKNTLLNICK